MDAVSTINKDYSFDLIPNEILTHIFNYLSVPILLKSEMVNKKWNVFSNELISRKIERLTLVQSLIDENYIKAAFIIIKRFNLDTVILREQLVEQFGKHPSIKLFLLIGCFTNDNQINSPDSQLSQNVYLFMTNGLDINALQNCGWLAKIENWRVERFMLFFSQFEKFTTLNLIGLIYDIKKALANLTNHPLTLEDNTLKALITNGDKERFIEYLNYQIVNSTNNQNNYPEAQIAGLLKNNPFLWILELITNKKFENITKKEFPSLHKLFNKEFIYNFFKEDQDKIILVIDEYINLVNISAVRYKSLLKDVLEELFFTSLKKKDYDVAYTILQWLFELIMPNLCNDIKLNYFEKLIEDFCPFKEWSFLLSPLKNEDKELLLKNIIEIYLSSNNVENLDNAFNAFELLNPFYKEYYYEKFIKILETTKAKMLPVHLEKVLTECITYLISNHEMESVCLSAIDSAWFLHKYLDEELKEFYEELIKSAESREKEKIRQNEIEAKKRIEESWIFDTYDEDYMQFPNSEEEENFSAECTDSEDESSTESYTG